MKDLDFIEIGTSNFDTLVQTCEDDSVGICVEPIKHYLDQLPNKKNILKVNVAITGDLVHDKKIKIYYIPEDIIVKERLHRLIRGCNKIGDYHPLHIKNKLTHLVKIDDVELVNIGEFLKNNKIRKIKHLRIDTEGHDVNIMKGLYNYICNLPEEFHPFEIKFETNSNTTNKEVDEVIELYSTLNYGVVFRKLDTLIKKSGIIKK